MSAVDATSSRLTDAGISLTAAALPSAVLARAMNPLLVLAASVRPSNVDGLLDV
jgi:hypothetical protein